MKYFFYILGSILFLFAPMEYASIGIGLFIMGIPFHISDIKEDILKHIEENTESLRFDHRQLKKDIKDLEVKN